MTCPYLSYRRSDGDLEFDTERAYCGVVEAFVSPMRADVCNDRHELTHERDCEFYREAESE
ncbi:hypothetical protein [Natrinema salaciae]|uniref:Uncharacterized protein n=1 Tax=Natrinema salaciae TaxID=1186196 RepID=A0A1H9NRC7_9EURY|nr:hypothetical protein [Natrinema salaciae]SER38530.1 hypothetical protein SAMN04489841_3707 [Natrinema salaciae]